MLSLERYRMLDLGRMLPGPFTSHVLADMGMEVIKVEEPEPRYGMGRDPFTRPDPTPEDEEYGAAYNPVARNKKSIALNLVDPSKRPLCQNIFYRLVQRADVVLEGYRPGAVKWMGVDYETIKRYNPRIIYCSLTGFGQTGPYATRPGHGGQFDAAGGAMRLEADGTPAHNGVVPLGDVSGALYASTSIVSALLHREHTGEGTYIDVSLAAAAMSLTVSASNRVAERPLRSSAASIGLLKCRDGKWLSTGNAETIFWENFCTVLGRADWIPLRRASGPEAEKMVTDIQDLFLTRDRSEWLDLLVKAETCVAPVNDAEGAFQDPQMRHVGMTWEMAHPKFGTITQRGFPVRYSGEAIPPGSFAPMLGEHTREVLSEAGYSAEEISAYEQAGIVRSWDS